MNKGYYNEIAVLLDDHKLFVDTFSALLEQTRLFSYVMPFSDPEKMMEYVIFQREAKIYFFLDYHLGETTVIPVLNQINRVSSHHKLILVSQASNPSLIKNIMSYKVNGFINKVSGYSTIIDCIKSIQRNEIYFCPAFQEIMGKNTETGQLTFSAREIEILQFVAKGHSIQETAELTYLSKHTIVNHRRNMMRKAGCKSVTELLAVARRLSYL